MYESRPFGWIFGSSYDMRGLLKLTRLTALFGKKNGTTRKQARTAPNVANACKWKPKHTVVLHPWSVLYLMASDEGI